MFKIGDFRRLTQVTGYRYYTSQQIPGLNHFLARTNFRFSIDQIRSVLDSDLCHRWDDDQYQ